MKMVRSEFHLEIAASAASRMMLGSSDLLVMPSSSENIVVECDICHGGSAISGIGSLSSASGGKRDSKSLPSLDQLLRVLRWGIA